MDIINHSQQQGAENEEFLAKMKVFLADSERALARLNTLAESFAEEVKQARQRLEEAEDEVRHLEQSQEL